MGGSTLPGAAKEWKAWLKTFRKSPDQTEQCLDKEGLTVPARHASLPPGLGRPGPARNLISVLRTVHLETYGRERNASTRKEPAM